MTWQVAKNMKREVAQTLQEARKMARSIENTVLSLEPLADEDTLLHLEAAATRAAEITGHLSSLYNEIAKAAFGPESAP